VRELANVMERAVILAEGNAITSGTLSFLKMAPGASNGDLDLHLPSEGISLEKMEADLARQAFELSGNNQTTAAKLLGLTRAKFRVLMRRANREIKNS